MEPASSPGISARGAFRIAVAITILVVLAAVVIGTNFLPNPYYVIGQGVFIAGVVALCASRLRNCYRLAPTSGQSAQLRQIALWGFVGVLSAAGLLVELSTAEQPPKTTVLVLIAFLLALLSALQLAENLLKRFAETNPILPGGGRYESKAPANQPLQPTGPA